MQFRWKISSCRSIKIVPIVWLTVGHVTSSITWHRWPRENCFKRCLLLLACITEGISCVYVSFWDIILHIHTLTIVLQPSLKTIIWTILSKQRLDLIVSSNFILTQNVKMIPCSQKLSKQLAVTWRAMTIYQKIVKLRFITFYRFITGCLLLYPPTFRVRGLITIMLFVTGYIY